MDILRVIWLVQKAMVWEMYVVNMVCGESSTIQECAVGNSTLTTAICVETGLYTFPMSFDNTCMCTIKDACAL